MSTYKEDREREEEEKLKAKVKGLEVIKDKLIQINQGEAEDKKQAERAKRITKVKLSALKKSLGQKLSAKGDSKSKQLKSKLSLASS